MSTAFALAGLGGFNAHGAGFLAAAKAWGIQPELVTATSGQILVLADWLRGDDDLKASLISPSRDGNPVAQLQTMLFGYPGVFKPAYGETLARFASLPNLRQNPIDIFADRFLPAQQYVPDRPEKCFQTVAEIFNDSATGVVFNSYDLTKGTGVLYGNDVARRALPPDKAFQNRHAAEVRQNPREHDMRYVSFESAETKILPINAEAVKSALWLSLYGFRNMPGGKMDGAYHRSCIVSVLHGYDRVFVARPLANAWTDKALPANWFEVQDWQCEMWFSVGYKAEVDALRRINDLIDEGVIADSRFKKVELVEIEPKTPAGYFNYFVERNEVYEDAYRLSEQRFANLGLRKPVKSAGLKPAPGFE
jgi:hypothetical protein